MAKDNNKYQVYVEYDGKTEKAVFQIAKNDRPIKYEDLPSNEQDMYKAILYNALVTISPEFGEPEGEK